MFGIFFGLDLKTLIDIFRYLFGKLWNVILHLKHQNETDMSQKVKDKKRKEIRIVTPSEELLKALEKRALLENRSVPNLAETILNKEFKIKPKL